MAMGIVPAQVNEMTLWEFTSACDGYDLANGLNTEEKSVPTDEEFAAVLRMHG